MVETILAFIILSQDRLEQWPQWRGPNANGIAPKADPPTEWSETKNIRWKVELPGSGSATPVVWGDRLFVLAAVKTDKKGEAPKATAPAQGGRGMSTGAPDVLYRFEVLCLDRMTGKEIWRRTAIEQQPHEGHHPSHGYASASPATDGKTLIASFGSRGIFAYDLEGKELWKRDLGDMRIKVGFGEGTSPVLHGDGVIVNWDHEGESFIVRLDAKTGKERYGATRLPGIEVIYASLAGAAGKVYVTGREGTTLVLKHGPAFEVLATNKLSEGIDASPVLVGKQLYLRGAKHLYCIESR